MTQPRYPFPHTYVDRPDRAHQLLGRITEATIEKAILHMLACKNILAWPQDAGGKRFHAIAGSASGHRGGIHSLPQGWPDILALLPGGRMMMIEVKRPPYMSGKRRIPEGKPTQIQLETLLKLHKQGALVLVAWSCQDVLEALNG